MNQIIAVTALLVCAFVGSGHAVAQSTYLTGTVRDPNLAAIHDAEVSVTSRGFSKTARTDENGSFAISLPPGDYLVTAAARGFETATTRVRVGDETRKVIELTLRVAGSTDVVTIVGSDDIGYHAESISSATKTLTALRDTPQSITVL